MIVYLCQIPALSLLHVNTCTSQHVLISLVYVFDSITASRMQSLGCRIIIFIRQNVKNLIIRARPWSCCCMYKAAEDQCTMEDVSIKEQLSAFIRSDSD